MNKKTLIIIVLVLVVIGGLYYGNNWLKGRSVWQAFQDTIKGTAQPGLGTGTDGGVAVKTPEDLFKETEEVVLSSKTLPTFKDMRLKVEKVFGESKVTSYGKYSDYKESFVATLKVPRVIIPEDLTKLEELYLKEGFETKTNEVSADSGTLAMSNSEETNIEFSCDFDNQNIKVWYIPAQSEE